MSFPALRRIVAITVLLLGALPLAAQPTPEQFMEEYARLLRAGDREGLIRLYSPRGTLVMGDGFEDMATLEQTADIYRNHWSGPTAFEWHDLNIRYVHPGVVVVSGAFDWTGPQFPARTRFNYSSVLALEDGKWRIRSELEFRQTDEARPSRAGAETKPGLPAAVACVFCDIVAGKRQTEGVIYRDEHVAAFLSIGPRNPGHVLIVPVAHANDFLEVPAITMHAMTAMAKRIAEAIKRTDLKMEGFQLQMNTGKAAGQSVFHAHLHLIPRHAGEPAAKLPEDRVSMEALAPIAAKIRAAMEKAPVEPPARAPGL
jgi:histidine triad (HIT) family protein